MGSTLNIQSYCPYDPVSMGIGERDEGEMRFPVISEKGYFLKSESARENICYMLGEFGRMSDIPLTNMYGEDSIKKLADGSYVLVYPPRDFRWHSDKDIVKYKLRISIQLDKNGAEKKRVLESIAPIVLHRDYDSWELTQEENELCWLDFKELKSILKKEYFLNSASKPVSYYNYILEKAKNAEFK